MEQISPGFEAFTENPQATIGATNLCRAKWLLRKTTDETKKKPFSIESGSEGLDCNI